MGKRGDPGGLQNARRFANRRTRPSHCISDDVGKTEMSGNILHSKVDRSAYIPVRRHKVASKIIVDEAHNAICTSAAQCVQDQSLPRHVVGNPRFFL